MIQNHSTTSILRMIFLVCEDSENWLTLEWPTVLAFILLTGDSEKGLPINVSIEILTKLYGRRSNRLIHQLCQLVENRGEITTYIGKRWTDLVFYWPDTRGTCKLENLGLANIICSPWEQRSGSAATSRKCQRNHEALNSST